MSVQLGTKLDGSDLWTLPIEPQISIKASNDVARRNVAKAYGFGSVKESWGRADYEITITGRFIADPDTNGFKVAPSADKAKLNTWMAKGKALKIISQDTQDLGIDQVCILDWEFPFTAGIQNQLYVIKCVSDYPFELVL